MEISKKNQKKINYAEKSEKYQKKSIIEYSNIFEMPILWGLSRYICLRFLLISFKKITPNAYFMGFGGLKNCFDFFLITYIFFKKNHTKRLYCGLQRAFFYPYFFISSFRLISKKIKYIKIERKKYI